MRDVPTYREIVEAFEADREGVTPRRARPPPWPTRPGEVRHEPRHEREPSGPYSATTAIGRGLEEAPVLRQGLGVTWLLAAIGAGGRVVVPILIQQAIDKGIRVDDDGDIDGVRIRFIVACAVIAVGALAIAAVCQRAAVVRLGTRSEQALNDLRTRLIDHIHRISLADHNDERRGALVARVTSDIETLADFFRWGGLAWLIDGTLMVIVAVGDARLQLVARDHRDRHLDPTVLRAPHRAAPPRHRVRQGPRAQRRDDGRAQRGRVGRRDHPGVRRRADVRGPHQGRRPAPGRCPDPRQRHRRVPLPAR